MPAHLGPILAAAIATTPHADFGQALVAPGPAPVLGEAAHVFDRLIGDWDVEFRDDLGDGRVLTSHGTWRFAWVLEGLLIEDVIVTPTDALPPDVPRRIGITIRTYDPKLGAWRVVFITPGTGVRNELIARRVGEDIVLTGSEKGVRPIRWSFVAFQPDGCTWRGESLADDGKTWKLESEFKLRRPRPRV